jgi:hypothetical protein
MMMKSVSSLRDKGFRGIGAGWGWDSAWLIVEYKTSALKKQVGDDEMIHHSYICISETAGGTKVSTKSATSHYAGSSGTSSVSLISGSDQ